MSTSEDHAERADLDAQVAEIAQRLGALRTSTGSGRTTDEVAAQAVEAMLSLEVAGEELRVAGEEVAAQQHEIARLRGLVEGSSGEQGRWERFAAALPVPALRTRHDGIVVAANPAAGRVLHVAGRYLIGKPLAAFVAVEDRAALRRMLAALGAGAGPGAVHGARPAAAAASDDGAAVDSGATTLPVRLAPRPAPGQPARPQPSVTAVALPEPAGGAAAALVSWYLLPAAPGPVAGAPVERPGPPGGAEQGPQRIGAAVVEIARLAAGAADLRHALAQGVRVVAEHIRGSASVSVGEPLAPREQTWSSREAQVADAAQLQAQEGPCVEAWVSGEVCATPDAGRDARWPRLTGLGGELRSAVGVPLLLGEETLGVLNAYPYDGSAALADLEDDIVLLGSALAAVLAEAQRRDDLARLAGQLEEALRSRAVIDQAIGIVMARLGLDAAAAFQHLATQSQHRNTKLREVARRVVEQTAARGDRPAGPTGPGRAGPAGAPRPGSARESR